MNVIQLTQYLSENPDEVLTLLHKLGFENISHNRIKNEFRFSRDSGCNPSSVKLDLNTLSFKCFSTNERGNIYTLVMDREEIKYFPDVLRYVALVLGLNKEEFNREIKLPFGGFYKDIVRQIEEPEYTLTVYDESILEPFLHKYNTMFFNDGIDYQTQAHFKVGYDLETNRITVPEYTLDGKLCGVMGRSIDSKCTKEERWLPIIPCSRSLTLYGYHQNYQSIQEKGLAIVVESEKSVMKLNQGNCHISLATCGCNISETQAKYLRGLLIPKIIVAFDEGLNEDSIIQEAMKLKVNNAIFNNKVGYIYDIDNKYLPKGSKLSPADMSKDIFTKLIKEYTVWIGDE